MLGLALSGWLTSVIIWSVLSMRARAMRTELNFGIHEIRRPLQQAFLLHPSCEPSHRAVSEALDGAVTALDELEARLNRLPVEPKREPVDIRGLIEGSVATQGVIGSSREAQVEWQACSGKVLGDRDRLQRIFDNLIDNAARHGASPLTVTARDCGRFIRVAIGNRTIRDDLDDPRAGGATGHGYGLRIVSELVSEHGGNFAYSRRSDDCEAVVELPLTRA